MNFQGRNPGRPRRPRQQPGYPPVPQYGRGVEIADGNHVLAAATRPFGRVETPSFEAAFLGLGNSQSRRFDPRTEDKLSPYNQYMGPFGFIVYNPYPSAIQQEVMTSYMGTLETVWDRRTG